MLCDQCIQCISMWGHGHHERIWKQHSNFKRWISTMTNICRIAKHGANSQELRSVMNMSIAATKIETCAGLTCCKCALPICEVTRRPRKRRSRCWFLVEHHALRPNLLILSMRLYLAGILPLWLSCSWKSNMHQTSKLCLWFLDALIIEVLLGRTAHCQIAIA